MASTSSAKTVAQVEADTCRSAAASARTTRRLTAIASCFTCSSRLLGFFIDAGKRGLGYLRAREVDGADDAHQAPLSFGSAVLLADLLLLDVGADGDERVVVAANGAALVLAQPLTAQLNV